MFGCSSSVKYASTLNFSATTKRVLYPNRKCSSNYASCQRSAWLGLFQFVAFLLCCYNRCDVYGRALFSICLSPNSTNEHRSKPQMFASQLKYFICEGKCQLKLGNVNKHDAFPFRTFKMLPIFVFAFWLWRLSYYAHSYYTFECVCVIVAWHTRHYFKCTRSWFCLVLQPSFILLYTFWACCVYDNEFLFFFLRFFFPWHTRKILEFPISLTLFSRETVSFIRWHCSFHPLIHFLSNFHQNEWNKLNEKLYAKCEWVHLNMIAYLYVRI